MFNKKGISGVITTVLIILISIAAILVVWQILKPSIVKSAEGINTQCINVDVSANQVTCSNSTGIATIAVTSNAVKLSKLVVLIADDSGTLNSTTDTTTPAELGSETETVTFTPTAKKLKASVGAFVPGVNGGEDQSCGIKVQSFDLICT